MRFTLQPSQLHNLKESLLIITTLYFYGLAFALQFKRPTFGLDQPVFFFIMFGLFLAAVILQIVLAWWNKRAYILWGTFIVITYGIIGFSIAPAVFGTWIAPYVLFGPLVITVFGGSVYSIVFFITRFLQPESQLTPAQLERSLRDLPGWNIVGGKLQKTFEFLDFVTALNFTNRIGVLAGHTQRFPLLRISGSGVEVTLISQNTTYVTWDDVQFAHQVDVL